MHPGAMAVLGSGHSSGVRPFDTRFASNGGLRYLRNLRNSVHAREIEKGASARFPLCPAPAEEIACCYLALAKRSPEPFTAVDNRRVALYLFLHLSSAQIKA